MKNIVLIGMMGSGKTTVGQLLAGRLKKTLVDTDRLIEAREGLAVEEIFATQGEDYFRSLEVGVAQALSLRQDLIIACGGGLPLREVAMAPLKESGTVFWLNRDAGDIYDHESMEGRPLAQEGREAFLAKAAEREETYRRWADVTITNFTSPISTAARVLEGLE
ncbi:MAG: shikimate kinase [Pseudoflavonifractor sp.]|nr:shikimate kinase [Pseudoflavonifractor sp.]